MSPLAMDLNLILRWAVPFAAVGLTLALILTLISQGRLGGKPWASGHRGQALLLRLLAILTAIIALPLLLPIGNELRGQLLSLLGLLLSAVVGLASTTFVSNAMAGLMQRSATRFEPGDFIGVGDIFGRVTERALFHTELQTEDRDLVTLPNLYLVTNPVKVVRASGTLVSATVSLGYDVSRRQIEKALLQAAERAELNDAFVQVIDLGDFSVSYRVSGFLEDVRRLLSQRSALKAGVLDALHGAGIEIVSPNFMNQRPIDPDRPVLPPDADANAAANPGSDASSGSDIERLMFDKADLASRLADLIKRRDELTDRLKQPKDAADKDHSTGRPHQDDPKNADRDALRQADQRELAVIERILEARAEHPPE
ncbi:MAG: mechanosensitive ion channel family protein [Pseudomonadota bacterium]